MGCNLFNIMFEKYKPKDKVRLIELFAGYGSTALGLKYLNVKFEHWKTCEWAMNSIIAYASIHRNELENYGVDYCKDLTKEQIAMALNEMGVSMNYNAPASIKQLNRVKEYKLRLCYNSIKWANNLVDITRVKGEDLQIEDTDEYDYIMTYSFPCQCLSLAGDKVNLKGANEINEDNIYDLDNRSNMLWQVERILGELKEKPQVLLLENVPMIHSKDNIELFNDFQARLEKLGYKSYSEDISATECGIPQTRKRTFMISLLDSKNGESYNYDFPKPIELKLRLKNLLESNVGEKYYLSQKMVNCFMSEGTSGYPRKEKFLSNIGRKNQDVGNAVTTLAGQRPTDNFVIDDKLFLSEKMINYIAADNEKYTGNNDKSLVNKTIASTINTKEGTRRCDASNYIAYGMPENTDLKQIIYGNKRLNETLESNNLDEIEEVAYVDAYNKTTNKDVVGTITTRVSGANLDFILIKNATKKGYLEATDGDGIDISGRIETHRGTVQKGKAQTITTMGGETVGVVVKTNPTNCEIDDCQVVGGVGVKKSNGGTQYYNQDRIYSSEVSSPTIATAFSPNYLTKLGIRKLTPRECFRLMGVKDEDIDLILENQVDSSAYHLAGDSIVVNCLMAIYGQLFNRNWEEYYNPRKWWKTYED